MCFFTLSAFRRHKVGSPLAPRARGIAFIRLMTQRSTDTKWGPIGSQMHCLYKTGEQVAERWRKRMGMGLNVQFVALSVTTIAILLVVIFASPAAAEERERDNSWCNGTIADCFGNELEMLMDSDMSRRFLQQGGKSFSRGSTAPNKPVASKCGRGRYQPCIPGSNGLPPRACNQYYRCGRDTGSNNV
ncbi:hypothetical protein Acr_29g0002140 [Actinidia rufa]|uniref:Ralf-like 33 n=1 Tax=Actinidia rufa TaxID=165716 RepID=A0A7J0HDH1_9ERIC|nr:hypothetical protein Acr_29g0002140 [Actinidia rufa]